MLSFCEWACDKFGKGMTPASGIASLMKTNPKAPRASMDPKEIEAFLVKVPVSQAQIRTFKQMFAEYQKAVK